MPQGQMPTRDALPRLLDALQTFIREHLALARVEIKEDLRGLGRDVAASASGIPALAVGYLLLMVAISWLLATWLPNWAAFGIVAVVNLAAGGLLTYRGAQRVRQDRIELPRTASELQRDRQWLASMKDGGVAVKPGTQALPTDAPQVEGTPH